MGSVHHLIAVFASLLLLLLLLLIVLHDSVGLCDEMIIIDWNYVFFEWIFSLYCCSQMYNKNSTTKYTRNTLPQNRSATGTTMQYGLGILCGLKSVKNSNIQKNQRDNQVRKKSCGLRVNLDCLQFFCMPDFFA